jgi:ribulose-5-phosphate 4-epimerase/fuculose-1-phosphate aldolase
MPDTGAPPRRDFLTIFQEFQADFAKGIQLLKDSGIFVYRRAGNISLRGPGTDRLIIANTNPPNSGLATAVNFDLTEIQGQLTHGLHEVVHLHIAVLKARPDVQAVIHLHTPYLTGYAVAGKTLPDQYIPLIAKARGGIPVSKFGTRYEAEPLNELLAEHPNAPGVLMSNHGPFAWGGSIREAVNNLITLEEAAHVFFVAEALGGARLLPEDAFARVEKSTGRLV